MTTPTRSTRINRSSSIAATLFGLLAIIAGTSAQAQCVCSPREYSVSFDLAQDCINTDEITGLPGIGDGRTKCNADLIEVTQVQIFEEGYDTNIKLTIVNYDPPVTSSTIEFVSRSNELISGVDLEDQAEVIIPQQIFVVLWGNDVNGTAISAIYTPYANIVYTNECGSPIEFDDSGLGNIRFTTVEAASVEWCRLEPSSQPSAQPSSQPSSSQPSSQPSLTSSPTKSPTVAPSKATPSSGRYSISMSMMRYGGKGGKSIRGKGGKNGERSYSTSMSYYYYYGAAGKGGKKSGTSGSSSGYGYGGKGGKKREEVI